MYLAVPANLSDTQSTSPEQRRRRPLPGNRSADPDQNTAAMKETDHHRTQESHAAAEAELTDQYVSMPLVRITRDGWGASNPITVSFPALLSLSASPR